LIDFDEKLMGGDLFEVQIRFHGLGVSKFMHFCLPLSQLDPTRDPYGERAGGGIL